MTDNPLRLHALQDPTCTACGGPVLQGWRGEFARTEPLFIHRGTGPTDTDALAGKVVHLRTITTVCIQCGHTDSYVDLDGLQMQLQMVDTGVWKLPNLD